jgi:hypothetical protein
MDEFVIVSANMGQRRLKLRDLPNGTGQRRRPIRIPGHIVRLLSLDRKHRRPQIGQQDRPLVGQIAQRLHRPGLVQPQQRRHAVAHRARRGAWQQRPRPVRLIVHQPRPRQTRNQLPVPRRHRHRLFQRTHRPPMRPGKHRLRRDAQ